MDGEGGKKKQRRKPRRGKRQTAYKKKRICTVPVSLDTVPGRTLTTIYTPATYYSVCFCFFIFSLYFYAFFWFYIFVFFGFFMFFIILPRCFFSDTSSTKTMQNISDSGTESNYDGNKAKKGFLRGRPSQPVGNQWGGILGSQRCPSPGGD